MTEKGLDYMLKRTPQSSWGIREKKKEMDYKFLEIAKFIWNKLSSESQSCLTLCDPWNSPGQNTGVSSHSLLQGIFPTQRSNPGLPHCRQILYQLGHKGSPRILEWVACPFSSGSSRPRNRTRVSCIEGGFCTS